MDLRQLRYFIAIVEQGSFSKAAQELGIAQPALSLHVRNMEEHLKTQLLFRRPSGVTPTDSGLILLRHAKDIIERFSIACEDVTANENEPTGAVRIGLPGTIGHILAVPLILKCKEIYPKITLHIAEAMSGYVVEWLQDSRIDISVLYLPAPNKKLLAQPVLTEELWLLGPLKPTPGQATPEPGPIPFADVLKLPLVLPSSSHGLRSLLDSCAGEHQLKCNPVLEVDSYSNIIELVGVGHGYSVLPFNAISQEVKAGQLLAWPIRDPVVRRSVYVVTPQENSMGAAVRKVTQLCKETLLELADSGKWTGVRRYE